MGLRGTDSDAFSMYSSQLSKSVSTKCNLHICPDLCIHRACTDWSRCYPLGPIASISTSFSPSSHPFAPVTASARCHSIPIPGPEFPLGIQRILEHLVEPAAAPLWSPQPYVCTSAQPGRKRRSTWARYIQTYCTRQTLPRARTHARQLEAAISWRISRTALAYFSVGSARWYIHEVGKQEVPT